MPEAYQTFADTAIKRGATLRHRLQLPFDVRPYVLTARVIIGGATEDLAVRVLGSGEAGLIELSAPPEQTRSWRVGRAYADIRAELSGSPDEVALTENIVIEVREEIPRA